MKAEIRNCNNLPSLYINGERTLPIIYALSDFPGAASNTFQAYKNIKNFHSAGIDLVEVDINLLSGWHKSTPFESEPMLMAVKNVVTANPEAKIMLRIHVNPPYWWLRDNPEECVIYRTPDGDKEGIDDGEPSRLIRNDAEKHLRVSLASEKWLCESGEKLKIFLKELRNSELAENVFAVQVSCGIYGEWHNWGVDVGPAMQKRFHKFIKEKYGTQDMLKKAYGSDAEFDNISLNPEDIQWHGEYKRFSCEKNNRRSFDSVKCELSSASDAIIHFCRIVKETYPELIAGAFYGYVFSLFGASLERGHLFIKDVSHSEYVDFLCGPFPYLDNRKKENMPMQRSLLESFRLNGKLWISEMDQEPAGTDMFVGGDSQKADESIAMLRRNILQPILSGHGAWYYDHRILVKIPEESQNKTCGSLYFKDGWWDSSILMNEIKNLNEFCNARFTQGDYVPAADVLVVYDVESLYTLNSFWNVEEGFADVIGKCGVAFDSIYMHDLEKADLDRYKCIIFANSWCVTQKQRDTINKLTKGKQIVWMYGSGFSDGETLCTENIEKTTGFKVKEIDGTAENEGFSKNDAILQAGECISDFRFEILDCEPVSRYKNSGKVCGGNKGDVWLFALPALNIEIMSEIFEKAKVHRYFKSNEPVMAGAGVVVLHTITGGERTIFLPNGKSVNHNLPKETTAVFDIETGAEIL